MNCVAFSIIIFLIYFKNLECFIDNVIIYILGCEVYNLGTGKGTSVLEMVAAFEKASGKVYSHFDFFFQIL